MTATHRVPLVRTRSGRTLVLGLAALTMVVEMGSLLVGRTVSIGSLPLSASLVPSLVLLGVLGTRGVGHAGDRDRLVPFWVAMAAGLLLGVALFSRTGHLPELFALLVAAANEEVVYRFAVPMVLTTALVVLKVPGPAARVAGYIGAGVWWVFLPGHQAQTGSALTLATYGSFAVISALVVSRSRALIPMSIAHCVLNVITFAQARGEISAASRGALAACLLFLLVGTFAWPGDRVTGGSDSGSGSGSGSSSDDDTVIDLRDGRPASVRHGDEVTWVDPGAPVPAVVPVESGDPSRR